jgi:6-phosphofructokinase 1
LAGYNDIMVGVAEGAIVDIPLDSVIRYRKGLDPQLFQLALLLHR